MPPSSNPIAPSTDKMAPRRRVRGAQTVLVWKPVGGLCVTGGGSLARGTTRRVANG